VHVHGPLCTPSCVGNPCAWSLRADTTSDRRGNRSLSHAEPAPEPTDVMQCLQRLLVRADGDEGMMFLLTEFLKRRTSPTSSFKSTSSRSSAPRPRQQEHHPLIAVARTKKPLNGTCMTSVGSAPLGVRQLRFPRRSTSYLPRRTKPRPRGSQDAHACTRAMPRAHAARAHDRSRCSLYPCPGSPPRYSLHPTEVSTRALIHTHFRKQRASDLCCVSSR